MKDITDVALNFAADEIKNHGSPKQYQKQIPENVKREAWKHPPIIENSSSIENFHWNILSTVLLEHQWIIDRLNLRGS